MLARLLVISGSAYVKKFVEKTGGIVIMQYRFKRWWNIATIWPICFAILFGQDIAAIDLERKFDLYNLLDSFESSGGAKIAWPEMLPVLTGMLQSGLKFVIKEQPDPDSPTVRSTNANGDSSSWDATAPDSTRARTMSLDAELATIGVSLPLAPSVGVVLMTHRLGEVEGTVPCRICFPTPYRDEISLGHARQVTRISRFCGDIWLRSGAAVSALPPCRKL
jgi:hypothetical protein